MRQAVKLCLSIFLSVLLATPFELLAQTPARDPHTVFRFNEIPSPNYYSRAFTLVGMRPVRDATSIDSDQIIRDDPQSQRGFQARWLLSNQAVAAVSKPTIVTCVGGSGEVIKISLKLGEAVVYDLSTKEILAITRCANKCIEGEIDLPAPVITEKIVEKPIYIPRPEFQIVEKPVFVERPAYVPPAKNPKAPGKKLGWLLPVIIGGVGAGIVTAILLNRNSTPQKTYPRERVISPP